jgi:hypothetical protein
MGNEQSEIIRDFRHYQDKYVYYIISLCVTAIGFSIYQTTGSKLSWVQLPLAIAILCWSLSIYSGLKLLKYQIRSLEMQDAFYKINQGNHPEVGNHLDLINAGIEGLKSAHLENSNNANSLSKKQQNLFYFGLFAFIVWHVSEMYCNTLS